MVSDRQSSDFSPVCVNGIAEDREVARVVRACGFREKQALAMQYNRLNAFSIFCLSTVLAASIGLLFGALIPLMFGVATDFGGPKHDGYIELARMLVAGEGFRFESGGPLVMHRPPVYPVLMMPITLLPGEWQNVAAILLNGVFAGVCGMFIYSLTQRLYTDQRAALLACGLFLLNPWLYRLMTLPHPALLHAALFLALAWCALQLLAPEPHFDNARHRRHLALGLGGIGGTMALTHGSGIAVFVAITGCLGLTLLWRHRAAAGAHGFWHVVAAGVLGVAIVAPWSARNASNFPMFFPVTTGASFNYFMGNIYWGLGSHNVQPELTAADNALQAGGIEGGTRDNDMRYWGVMNPQHEQTLMANMGQHARANPADVLVKSVLATFDMFLPVTHMGLCAWRSNPSCEAESMYVKAHRVGLSVYMGSLLLLAYMGFRRLRGNHVLAWGMLVMGALHFLPYAPLGQWAPHGIYALNTMSLLVAFSGAGVLYWWLNRGVREDVPMAPAPAMAAPHLRLAHSQSGVADVAALQPEDTSAMEEVLQQVAPTAAAEPARRKA